MRSRTVALAISLSALVAPACVLGPRYVRPEVATPPAAFKEAAPRTSDGTVWRPAQPDDAALGGVWWTAFSDPLLDDLESRVDVSNQSLKTADAQYAEARAMVRSARADFYPTVGASASITAQHVAAGHAAVQAGTTADFTEHTLTADVSYELDVWGKIRNNVASASAAAQASAADLATVRLSLQTELAVDYLQLRGQDAQRHLFEETIAAEEKALELTNNLYAQGVAAKADVVQATSLLESTRAAAVDLGVLRSTLEHAIAVLVGENPSSFSIPMSPLEGTVPVIPLALPSELLERRPDVAAAERRAAAANAQIGVAMAAYYPDITFSATGGFQSTSLASWLDWPARFWSLGGALAATLFEGGRRHALTDQARASYDASVATYRQSVLTAFQEVEDSLAALRILAEEAEQLDAATEASDESLRLALNRYRGGVASYLNVVTAQTANLLIRRDAVGVATRRMVASVQLVKALGGGWTASSLGSAAAAPDRADHAYRSATSTSSPTAMRYHANGVRS
jgi:NodT family efflux transporter outer membrane factor (OMF) lipoprotein